MNAKISVITPTYYRNDTLRETIESVLSQDYEPVEHIVVDDSGEGHAKPVLDDYEEVTGIVRDENGGWQAAYTTGIEASTGEYVHFLDDDDQFLDGKLTKTTQVLEKNPAVGVAYSGAIRGGEKYYPKPEVSGDILEHALGFKTFPLWTGSMLMERDVLTDCLPMAGMSEDDDLNIELGDTDLKIELARRTKFDYVDECLVVYRRDGDNELWTGERRFKKVRENVRHQRELYDQYPEVRDNLLSGWYRREGNYWLQQQPWSARAIVCFAKATYHAREDRIPKTVEMGASLFGRPGVEAARRLRDIALGSPEKNTQQPKID